MENEELIRKKMEHTRESLTDKLETLEDKILGSVQQATSAVNQTVANVKETVNEGMTSVKDAVDIPAHVDRHPWLALGGSVLCGFMLGSMFSGSREPRPRRPTTFRPPGSNGTQATPESASAGSAPGGLLGVLDPEIQHLKGLAVGAALGMVREMLSEQVPSHMGAQLRQVIDGITQKLGGEPVPSSDFKECLASADKCHASSM